MVCSNCIIEGVCQARVVRLVSDAEIEDPNFVIKVRRLAATLSVPHDGWLEFLSRLYCDYDGIIVDKSGNETFLDLEVFEEPNIRFWFRDFCKAPVENVRVKKKTRERIRTFATLLRAYFPKELGGWLSECSNADPLRI
ncbi:MAG: hypothetical protein AAF720_02575 [Pseudomonadota bacterium]